MEQFKKYLEHKIQKEIIYDRAKLRELGVKARYIPDSFEYLDEVEFVLDYQPEKSVIIGVAVEKEIIKRIMFGWVGPEDDEYEFRKLHEGELAEILSVKDETLRNFFDGLIQS